MSELEPDDWIVCPECGNKDAYVECSPTYRFDGDRERRGSDDVILWCRECDTRTEVK